MCHLNPDPSFQTPGSIQETGLPLKNGLTIQWETIIESVIHDSYEGGSRHGEWQGAESPQRNPGTGWTLHPL
jgi:hypothetical protein